MSIYDESILAETKKVLGLDESVVVYDQDVLMHINSAIGTLSQLGIGPTGGFEVEDATAKWSDFLSTDLHLSPVKTYVYLRVRLLFDPPSNSWTTTAMKQQIEELEWRLNVVREDTIPLPADLSDQESDYVLDGGVIL